MDTTSDETAQAVTLLRQGQTQREVAHALTMSQSAVFQSLPSSPRDWTLITICNSFGLKLVTYVLQTQQQMAEMGDATLLDQTIKKLELVYRCIGITIRSGKHVDRNPTITMRIWFLFNIWWLVTDVLGGYYYFFDGITTGKDFLGLTYSAPCFTIATLSCAKAYAFVYSEKSVYKIIDKLNKLEKKEKSRQRTDEKDNIIKSEVDFLHFVISGNSWLYTSSTVLFAINPIAIMTIKYLNSGTVAEWLFPFLVRYPFDPYTTVNYPLVYFHQIWAELLCCAYLWSADVFFFTCCTYIRIQFKLLQHNIKNVFPANDDTERFLDDDDFKDKFREIVQWHQDLIESVQSLENLFTKVNLLNFSCSSLIICLTGFNVTMVNDLAVVATFVSFLILSLFQVFSLCYFADLLMTSSAEIRDAVYQSRWYTAEASVEKKLLLVQTRAQRPCQLTAYGFADVNLNSFMRVCSSAWSYFALLRTLFRD